MSLLPDLSRDEIVDSSSDSPVEKEGFRRNHLNDRRYRRMISDYEEKEGKEVSTDTILERLSKSQAAILKKNTENSMTMALLKSKRKLENKRAYD